MASTLQYESSPWLMGVMLEYIRLILIASAALNVAYPIAIKFNLTHHQGNESKRSKGREFSPYECL
jgi:hypothetical protein